MGMTDKSKLRREGCVRLRVGGDFAPRVQLWKKTKTKKSNLIIFQDLCWVTSAFFAGENKLLFLLHTVITVGLEKQERR